MAQQHPEEGCVDLQDLIPISPKTFDWIKDCNKNLKISKVDLHWAAVVVNDFRDNLQKFLKSNNDQPFFQSAELVNTGSYFEKVKIYSPNEFDMMVKLQVPSPITMTMLDDGLFYRLNLNRPTRSAIKAFLLENERISSSMILTEMYRLVRKFLKTYRVPDERCRWDVNRKRLNSPAVTLSLCRNDNHNTEVISVDLVPALEVHPRQGWPKGLGGGPKVDDWLGKKVRKEIMSSPCIFVPKRLKGRNDDAKESWRISFSLIEKELINKHGNKKTCCEANDRKCCRKQCLMLLKSLIEGLKQRFPMELEELCSYHGKTVFLHTLSIRFSDTMWAPKQLPHCFMLLLGELEKCARGGVLPHFFVPGSNLFSTRMFPRKKLSFLANALEEQKRDGLPLLQPPAPVSPLNPVCLPEEFSIKLDPQLAEHPKNMLVVVFVLALGLCFLFICMQR